MVVDPDSNISPDDIALLLSVPLTQADFVAAVGTSDWLSKFNTAGLDGATRAQRLTDRWNTEFWPLFPEPLLHLRDFAADLKVEVRLGAKLLDIRECTSSKSVVILFAHWKGPELVSDDFVKPVDRGHFVERLRSCEMETPFVRYLSAALSANESRRPGLKDRLLTFVSGLLGGGPNRGPSLRDVLTKALMVDIAEEYGTSGGVQQVLELDITRMSRRRDTMDSVFQGLLNPGNRLELPDGFHTKEETEVSIASSFEGVLDLTVCTSTVLGDYIGARRRHALRVVQFPTVQELLWGAECISKTLRLVAEDCQPYLRARLMASKLVEQEVRRLGHQNGVAS